jgi:hypothetical protein
MGRRGRRRVWTWRQRQLFASFQNGTTVRAMRRILRLRWGRRRGGRRLYRLRLRRGCLSLADSTLHIQGNRSTQKECEEHPEAAKSPTREKTTYDHSKGQFPAVLTDNCCMMGFVKALSGTLDGARATAISDRCPAAKASCKIR